MSIRAGSTVLYLYLIKPLTPARLGYSRIVALVRNNVQYRILTEHMENDLSTFWIKVGARGSKGAIVGGIYREHTPLRATHVR